MASVSKRAQLEAQGWTFTAVPSRVSKGVFRNFETGWESPAYDDYKRPEAWVATPPDSLSINEQRFENSSPNPAVRWAYGQATAPQVPAELTGVARIAALMGQAEATGLVADVQDNADRAPQRLDAELLSLCSEIVNSERTLRELRAGTLVPERASVIMQMDRIKEADRASSEATNRLVELKATTQAGVVAKARVIGDLFGATSGLKEKAIRSLAADVVAVLSTGSGK